MAQTVKTLPAIQETWVRFLSWEDPLEKGMATHSSILAWITPLTAACQGPLSMGISRQILEWVAISFSRGSSQLRNRTHISCIAGRFFTD